ncbi:hypothetical protein CBR_g50136 [Chara braunii]|uniref:Protein kinase domain-containing protein n=1 Tax=Chara braunii TaxID=69332 RepID=A0A388M6D7_CHABU|nr:hypothetical protein CBR_g50136 [Chara braunii]|eukprot:GBG90043.1 hypothetical protein CBR_g50136 [Chara braunii]
MASNKDRYPGGGSDYSWPRFTNSSIREEDNHPSQNRVLEMSSDSAYVTEVDMESAVDIVTQIDLLRDELDQERRQRKKLWEQLEEAVHKLMKTEADNVTLRRRLNKEIQVRYTIEKAKKDLEGMLEVAQGMMEEEKRCSDLNRVRLAALQSKLESETELRTRMQSKIGAFQRVVSRNETDLASSKLALTVVKKLDEDRESQLAIIRGQLQIEAYERAQVEERAEEFERLSKDLTSQLASTQAEKQRAEKSVADVRGQLQRELQERQTLEALLEESREVAKTFETELTAVRLSSTEERSLCRQSLAEANSQMQLEIQKRIQMKRQVEELERRVEETEMELATTKMSLESEKGRVADQEAEIKAARVKNTHLEKRRAEAEGIANDLELQLSSVMSVLVGERKKVEDSEAEAGLRLDSEIGEKNRLETELWELERRARDLEASLASTRSDLAAERMAAADTGSTLSAAIQAKARLEARLEAFSRMAKDFDVELSSTRLALQAEKEHAAEIAEKLQLEAQQRILAEARVEELEAVTKQWQEQSASDSPKSSVVVAQADAVVCGSRGVGLEVERHTLPETNLETFREAAANSQVVDSALPISAAALADEMKWDAQPDKRVEEEFEQMVESLRRRWAVVIMELPLEAVKKMVLDGLRVIEGGARLELKTSRRRLELKTKVEELERMKRGLETELSSVELELAAEKDNEAESEGQTAVEAEEREGPKTPAEDSEVLLSQTEEMVEMVETVSFTRRLRREAERKATDSDGGLANRSQPVQAEQLESERAIQASTEVLVRMDRNVGIATASSGSLLFPTESESVTDAASDPLIEKRKEEEEVQQGAGILEVPSITAGQISTLRSGIRLVGAGLQGKLVEVRGTGLKDTAEAGGEHVPAPLPAQIVLHRLQSAEDTNLTAEVAAKLGLEIVGDDAHMTRVEEPERLAGDQPEEWVRAGSADDKVNMDHGLTDLESQAEVKSLTCTRTCLVKRAEDIGRKIRSLDAELTFTRLEVLLAFVEGVVAADNGQVEMGGGLDMDSAAAERGLPTGIVVHESRHDEHLDVELAASSTSALTEETECATETASKLRLQIQRDTTHLKKRLGEFSEGGAKVCADNGLVETSGVHQLDLVSDRSRIDNMQTELGEESTPVRSSFVEQKEMAMENHGHRQSYQMAQQSERDAQRVVRGESDVEMEKKMKEKVEDDGLVVMTGALVNDEAGGKNGKKMKEKKRVEELERRNDELQRELVVARSALEAEKEVVAAEITAKLAASQMPPQKDQMESSRADVDPESVCSESSAEQSEMDTMTRRPTSSTGSKETTAGRELPVVEARARIYLEKRVEELEGIANGLESKLRITRLALTAEKELAGEIGGKLIREIEQKWELETRVEELQRATERLEKELTSTRLSLVTEKEHAAEIGRERRHEVERNDELEERVKESKAAAEVLEKQLSAMSSAWEEDKKAAASRFTRAEGQLAMEVLRRGQLDNRVKVYERLTRDLETELTSARLMLIEEKESTAEMRRKLSTEVERRTELERRLVDVEQTAKDLETDFASARQQLKANRKAADNMFAEISGRLNMETDRTTELEARLEVYDRTMQEVEVTLARTRMALQQAEEENSTLEEGKVALRHHSMEEWESNESSADRQSVHALDKAVMKKAIKATIGDLESALVSVRLKLEGDKQSGHEKRKSRVSMLRRRVQERIQWEISSGKGITGDNLTTLRAVSGHLSGGNRVLPDFPAQLIRAATDNFDPSNKIGEGRFSALYTAELGGEFVVVKKLVIGNADRGRFRAQCESLSELYHPCLMELIGICSEECCLLTEYAAAGSLADRLSCKGGSVPINWETRLRIAADVANALSFLHSQEPNPIIHNRVRPANILLGAGYSCKITAVGIEKIASECAREFSPEEGARRRRLNGFRAHSTLEYMDPALLQAGCPRTPTCDIYSFGLVLLELLTGKRPTESVSTVESALEEDDNKLQNVLDKSAGDWNLALAYQVAQLAMNCIKGSDYRPDFPTVIYPFMAKVSRVSSQPGMASH